MTEEEMEKLFKSKLDKQEFAFNPENWQRMEAILDEKSATRSGYFWRSAAAILLFGALVAGLIYINPAVETPAGMQQIADPENGTNQIFDIEGQQDPITNESDINGNDGSDEGSAMPAISEGGSVTVATQNRSELPDEESAIASEEGTDREVAVAETGSADADPVLNADPENFESQALLILEPREYNMPGVEMPDMYAREMDLASGEMPGSTPLIKTHNLFINAGPVLSGSNTDNTLGMGLQAGLGYRHALPYGFAVETGLSYIVLNDVNIENKSDSTFFNFGMERVEIEEKTHRMEYIELPLNVSYRLAPKHQLGIGGYMSVLVSVEREVQKTHYTIKQGTTAVTVAEKGYLDDFNRFDYGLNFFYRYSVSPRFKVGLHFKQGLLDITNDISGEYTLDHTNFNSRIILEYSLF